MELGSATGEDVVDCLEEIMMTDVAGNAADFLVVFEHNERRDDADGLCQADFTEGWIVKIDEADRDFAALFGSLVVGQELATEDAAVNATWDFKDDKLQVCGRGCNGRDVAGCFGRWKCRNQADDEDRKPRETLHCNHAEQTIGRSFA